MLRQDRIYYQFGDETVTPGYFLINASISTGIHFRKKNVYSIYLTGNNPGNVVYQSNMSRLKYADANNVAGRTGVFNMGRNIGFRLVVPVEIQK